MDAYCCSGRKWVWTSVGAMLDDGFIESMQEKSTRGREGGHNVDGGGRKERRMRMWVEGLREENEQAKNALT